MPSRRSSSSSSDKSKKSDKSHHSEEHHEEVACDPFPLARYYLTDPARKNRNENLHGSHDNVFSGHLFEGQQDWHLNHARLCAPGSSKVTAQFKLPVDSIREVHPDAKFILKCKYFGPW